MGGMHEVSLIESVVAIVADERKRQVFSRVRTIRLELGALGHAEPDALRFCFEAVTRSTIADGARLMIDIIPGEGRCSACGQRVAMVDRFAACSLCGNPQLRMIGGCEMRVAELEVE
jgi:hydrogenase nickel incorporation protein HypA/HybF